MLLKNASILYGNDLKFVAYTDLKISEQVFKKIKPSLMSSRNEQVIDCEGLLLVPGFVNSHTHIGDSIGKDIVLNKGADEKIHPIFGIKPKILKNSNPGHLATFMKNSCRSMIKKGITTFVDFREGGLEGVNLLKQVLSSVPIRSIILGRLEYYQNSNQIRKNVVLSKIQRKQLEDILKKCDGIGISGPNENSNSVLRYYSESKKNSGYTFSRNYPKLKYF